MDLIRWFQAPVDASIVERVGPFDHYRIAVADESAVLITYLAGSNQRRLLAVTHPAAQLHPDPPGWVIELLTGLEWSLCPAPTG